MTANWCLTDKVEVNPDEHGGTCPICSNTLGERACAHCDDTVGPLRDLGGTFICGPCEKNIFDHVKGLMS